VIHCVVIWLFGTGQYLSGNDLSQSNTQTLYGIRDDGTLSGKTTISANLLAQSIGSQVTTSTESNGNSLTYYTMSNNTTSTISAVPGQRHYLPTAAMAGICR
jgi:type IV pilus assembly protein PilY1